MPATRRAQQATKRQEPPRPVHELTIPDELIEWGRNPDVCRGWLRPWAHEALSCLQKAEAAPDQTLDHRGTEALLSRLEALCAEAIVAGRGDLLVGFDLWTSSLLGLRFTFEREGTDPVRFGGPGGYRYDELRTLVTTNPNPEAVAFVERCKKLVSDVFPRGRIGAIIEGEPPAKCTGCGTAEHPVMMSMNTGSEYCRPCWEGLTEKWPSLEELLGKKKGKAKR